MDSGVAASAPVKREIAWILPTRTDGQPDQAVLEALKTPKERAIVLSLEEHVRAYVLQKKKDAELELPASSSNYQRLLAHRVAQYYGLKTSTVDYGKGSGPQVIATWNETPDDYKEISPLTDLASQVSKTEDISSSEASRSSHQVEGTSYDDFSSKAYSAMVPQPYGPGSAPAFGPIPPGIHQPFTVQPYGFQPAHAGPPGTYFIAPMMQPVGFPATAGFAPIYGQPYPQMPPAMFPPGAMPFPVAGPMPTGAATAAAPQPPIRKAYQGSSSQLSRQSSQNQPLPAPQVKTSSPTSATVDAAPTTPKEGNLGTKQQTARSSSDVGHRTDAISAATAAAAAATAATAATTAAAAANNSGGSAAAPRTSSTSLPGGGSSSGYSSGASKTSNGHHRSSGHVSQQQRPAELSAARASVVSNGPAGRKAVATAGAAQQQQKATPNDHVLCPLSLKIMKDPVLLVGSGHTYDRASIEDWLDKGNKTDPISGQTLKSFGLVANHHARSLVLDWCQQHPDYEQE